MALKAPGGKDGDSKILIAGLICVFLSIAGFAYTLLREPNEEEKKAAAELKKRDDETARMKKASQPPPPVAPPAPPK